MVGACWSGAVSGPLLLPADGTASTDEVPVGGMLPWVVALSPGGRLPLLEWAVSAGADDTELPRHAVAHASSAGHGSLG